MKADIHPTYHSQITVTCACGNSFVTGSTVDTLRLDICSNCHPFFTGTAKLLDTAGRVDKFKERMARAQDQKAKKSAPKSVKGDLVTATEVAAETATAEEAPKE